MECTPDQYYSNINHFLEDTEQTMSNLYDTHVVHVPRSEWAKRYERLCKNFIDFDVYDLVEDQGQQAISSGWVILKKTKFDKKIINARLVIHGNQEPETVRSDSPTVCKQSLRIQFTIAAQNRWYMHSADVIAAFLQAKQNFFCEISC